MEVSTQAVPSHHPGALSSPKQNLENSLYLWEPQCAFYLYLCAKHVSLCEELFIYPSRGPSTWLFHNELLTVTTETTIIYSHKDHKRHPPISALQSIYCCLLMQYTSDLVSIIRTFKKYQFISYAIHWNSVTECVSLLLFFSAN